jgi:hypothetical protein
MVYGTNISRKKTKAGKYASIFFIFWRPGKKKPDGRVTIRLKGSAGG